jgi:hypothetical protein
VFQVHELLALNERLRCTGPAGSSSQNSYIGLGQPLECAVNVIEVPAVPLAPDGVIEADVQPVRVTLAEAYASQLAVESPRLLAHTLIVKLPGAWPDELQLNVAPLPKLVIRDNVPLG